MLVQSMERFLFRHAGVEMLVSVAQRILHVGSLPRLALNRRVNFLNFFFELWVNFLLIAQLTTMLAQIFLVFVASTSIPTIASDGNSRRPGPCIIMRGAGLVHGGNLHLTGHDGTS